ncbi:MAG TPA: hypothetical protein DCR64_06295 [Vibrio sp.]|nr:hypothetical protein [Vibrio sp.]
MNIDRNYRDHLGTHDLAIRPGMKGNVPSLLMIEAMLVGLYNPPPYVEQRMIVHSLSIRTANT